MLAQFPEQPILERSVVSAAFALLVAGRQRLAAAVEVQAEPDQGVEQPSSTAVPGP